MDEWRLYGGYVEASLNHERTGEPIIPVGSIGVSDAPPISQN
jgi:hypothetical protein